MDWVLTDGTYLVPWITVRYSSMSGLGGVSSRVDEVLNFFTFSVYSVSKLGDKIILVTVLQPGVVESA